MKPSIFLSNLENHCLTFFWQDQPNWYVGYRLIEGDPLTIPSSTAGLEERSTPTASTPPAQDHCIHNSVRPPYPEWLCSYYETNPSDPIQFTFYTCSDGSAHCSAIIYQGNLKLEWDFDPDETGIWIKLKVTSNTIIPAIYGLQQCLRFTGGFNEYWRRIVAHTPFLSEFDLQAMGQPNLTLTYARTEDDWLAFPVAHTILPTQIGQYITPSNVALEHGLVLRQTVDRKLSPAWYWEQVAPGATWDSLTSGMYWERTLLVSNRHPADCLHAVVNIGPLQAGESRTLHGKFYWIEGARDDLLSIWQKDFE